MECGLKWNAPKGSYSIASLSNVNLALVVHLLMSWVLITNCPFLVARHKFSFIYRWSVTLFIFQSNNVLMVQRHLVYVVMTMTANCTMCAPSLKMILNTVVIVEKYPVLSDSSLCHLHYCNQDYL